MTSPFLYVTGTPSGGTSCLAGVLHQLGVNLGRWHDGAGQRGYTTFEDQDATGFRVDPSGSAAPHQLRLRFRLADYVRHRKALDPYGRLGLKGPAFHPLREPLRGLQVVVVERPLADSIESDLRIHRQIRIAKNRPSMTPIEECERASEIAAAWAAARRLDAVLRIPFYGLLEQPLPTLQLLVSTLKLDPSPGMIDAALEFIDPEKRHV